MNKGIMALAALIPTLIYAFVFIPLFAPRTSKSTEQYVVVGIIITAILLCFRYDARKKSTELRKIEKLFNISETDKNIIRIKLIEIGMGRTINNQDLIETLMKNPTTYSYIAEKFRQNNYFSDTDALFLLASFGHEPN